MNDWWYDPPEYDDAPACPECGGYASYLTAAPGVERYRCDEEGCGHDWLAYREPDPGPDDFMIGPDFEPSDMEPPPAPAQCPHGNAWHECNYCMQASDFACDAAREARHFFRR